jgi:hypothetical protein
MQVVKLGTTSISFSALYERQHIPGSLNVSLFVKCSARRKERFNLAIVGNGDDDGKVYYCYHSRRIMGFGNLLIHRRA